MKINKNIILIFIVLFLVSGTEQSLFAGSGYEVNENGDLEWTYHPDPEKPKPPADTGDSDNGGDSSSTSIVSKSSGTGSSS